MGQSLSFHYYCCCCCCNVDSDIDIIDDIIPNENMNHVDQHINSDDDITLDELHLSSSSFSSSE